MIAPVVVGSVVAVFQPGVIKESRGLVMGVVTAAVLVAPIPVITGGFLVFAVRRFRRAALRTRALARRENACLEALELVVLGLAGGLSIAGAHRLALDHVAPPGREPLGRLVQRMQRHGTMAALVADEGPMSGGSHAVAAAAASGAAALPALRAHIEVEAHRHHSQRVERAKRLPIRLMLPLTLLVLPGFVLMIVGPTVVDSLARLTN